MNEVGRRKLNVDVDTGHVDNSNGPPITDTELNALIAASTGSQLDLGNASA